MWRVYKTLFFLLLLSATYYSCGSKEESKSLIAPNASSIGSLSATINNISFNSCENSSGVPNFRAQALYNETAGKLILHGIDFCKEGQYILLELNSFEGVGSYDLSHLNFGQVQINTAILQTDSLHIGKVLISDFDTVKKEISGTFYFDAIGSNNIDTARVRMGTLARIKY